jgi:hypothetical protein
MSLDPSSLEAELRKLRPATPGESLIARLEGCAEATWTELDPMEIQFERQLRATTPAALPPSLMASLEAAVRDVPFPTNVKIVAFPQGRTPTTNREPKRRWWSAAAAVAILGASAAFLVPARQNDAPATANNTPVTRPTITPNTQLTPAGFNRGLSEASDEGVIWQSENRPHRVLRVVYKDQVTLRDENGRTYQVERPRVEYILVPAKAD